MRFLFVDRIFELTTTRVCGIKHVTREDFYLYRDEDKRLCFIPALIGETLGQLAAWAVMKQCHFSHRPVAGLVGSAQSIRPVYVGETLQLESIIDTVDEQAVRYQGIAKVGESVVFRVENAIGPLLPMAQFIDEQEVCRQFNHIYRPGPWPPLESIADANSDLAYDNARDCMTYAYDSIIDYEAGGYITAQKMVTGTAPYFPDHFPYKPVLPMTILLACKMNLAAEFVAKSYTDAYRLQELRKIKMNEFVYPGDLLISHLKVKEHTDKALTLTVRSEVAGKRVMVLEMVFISKENI